MRYLTSALDASAARATDDALGSYSGKVPCSQFVSVKGVSVSPLGALLRDKITVLFRSAGQRQSEPILRWIEVDSQAEFILRFASFSSQKDFTMAKLLDLVPCLVHSVSTNYRRMII